MNKSETNTVRGDSLPEYSRSFGYVLLGAALGTVFFMTHHPQSATGMTGIAAMVHGVMLVMLLMLASGFVHFALALGLRHTLVLTGLVTYLAAAAGNGLAAVINGFVVPTLAGREGDVIGHDVFDLAWDLNQALAKLAVIGTGAAYVMWSLHLLRRCPRQPWLGGLGLAVGLAPAAALLSGQYGMDVSTALIIYAAQVFWAACIGVMMIRSAQ